MIIAEPLNIVLQKYKNVKDILYLYNTEFNFEILEFNEWLPSESDKDMIGEYEYDRMVRSYHEGMSKRYFKNVIIKWDSCDCGDGYGCSHGSWIYEVNIKKPDYIKNNLINKIQNSDSKLNKEYWILELEQNRYTTVNTKLKDNNTLKFMLPKTLNDFISDCCRVGIMLEWNDWIINNYFNSKFLKNDTEEKQLELF